MIAPNASSYVEEVRSRLAGILSQFYPGWEVAVTAEGEYPATVLKITTPTGKANAVFKVWGEDWNDLDSWGEPSFLSAELYRYYEAGYRS